MVYRYVNVGIKVLTDGSFVEFNKIHVIIDGNLLYEPEHEIFLDVILGQESSIFCSDLRLLYHIDG